MAISDSSSLPALVLSGDVKALARAATLVENQSPAGRQLITSLYKSTGRALLLGVTGPPGAGKSTLVDQLILHIRASGKTVAVIAVDPSSPFSRGAILGDRIRMQRHHEDRGVFIRSMSNRGRLGGLARGTLAMALLFDAAGYDYVVIETIGAGQDEVAIAHVAEITLLVLTPSMGDDVQANKAGIMEIADVFAINKADLPGADLLEQEIRAMQSVAADAGCLTASPVRRVVAASGAGVADLLDVINAVAKAREPGAWSLLWERRLGEMLRDELLESLPAEAIRQHSISVAEKIEDPYSALAALTKIIRKS